MTTDAPAVHASTHDDDPRAALIAHVRDGNFDLAAVLTDAVGSPDPGESWLARSALRALGILAAREGNAGLAAKRFARVRRATPPGHPDLLDALRDEIEALAALPDADAADRAVAEACAAIAPAPLPRGIVRAHARLPGRGFVRLVNTGRFDEARVWAGRHAVGLPHPALRAAMLPDECDVAFALAVLDMQHGGNLSRAAARFRLVRRHADARRPLPSLAWAALRGEVVALDRAGRDPRPVLRTALAEWGMKPEATPPDLRLLLGGA